MASISEPETNFRGQTVLVTGATSGIGEATAIAFGAAGAHVLVSGRDRQRGEKTCEAVRRAGGKATLLLADLTHHQAVLELARSALDLADGSIQVLVNCAGAGAGSGFQASEDFTEQDFDHVYSLNVRAPFFLTTAIAPKMAKQGRGTIVNVASAGTEFGIFGLSLFSSAKAALNAMTRNWAAEYGPFGVTVNSINLGPFKTRVNADFYDAIDALVEKIPARRAGLAEEAAAVAVFLATPAARFIQGVVLPVDGGFSVTSRFG